MTNDKQLVTTVRTTIHQRETGVDTIRFLLPLQYEGLNLSEFTVVVKYVSPDNVSHCELLHCQEDLYNNRLDYRLGVDTDITAMAGSVKLRLTLLNVVALDDGKYNEQVFHSDETIIQIVPIDEYIFIPDKSLEVIDQILLQLDNRMAELEDTANSINTEKADDIEIINGEIWLTREDPITGEKIPIGDPISGASHVWEQM